MEAMERYCEHEQEVARAVRTGFWSPELREHAERCEACTESMLVASWLMETEQQAEVTVPEAGLVWWKAERRMRRERVERALRPVLIAERVSAAAVLAALTVSAVWLAAATPSLTSALAGGVAVLAISAGSALYVAHLRK